MTESEVPSSKRLKLSRKELEDLNKEELIDKWMEQEHYLDALELRISDGQKDSVELVALRESEDKLRQQQLESTRRENLLVMRLAAKEQEMQEYANQIQELKQAQTPTSAQLRNTFLDPAVNLMFERMKKELLGTKAKLEETQNELSAWKFTPDSNTGKRLMAKCRQLYQENEELGKTISTGRLAKLEGDLALQKSFSEEMKKSQAELDEFLLELDEDVEGMQSTILYLQQQLRDAKDQVVRLQNEKQQLLANGDVDMADVVKTNQRHDGGGVASGRVVSVDVVNSPPPRLVDSNGAEQHIYVDISDGAVVETVECVTDSPFVTLVSNGSGECATSAGMEEVMDTMVVVEEVVDDRSEEVVDDEVMDIVSESRTSVVQQPDETEQTKRSIKRVKKSSDKDSSKQSQIVANGSGDGNITDEEI